KWILEGRHRPHPPRVIESDGYKFAAIGFGGDQFHFESGRDREGGELFLGGQRRCLWRLNWRRGTDKIGRADAVQIGHHCGGAEAKQDPSAGNAVWEISHTVSGT